MIYDLTDKIASYIKTNYFVFNLTIFNPSIVKIENDRYLISFRVMISNVPEPYHIWRIWNEGHDGIISQKYPNLYWGLYPRNGKLCEEKKISFSDKSVWFDKNTATYDNTGFCIGKIDSLGRFDMEWCHPAPTGYFNMYDVRLSYINNVIHITGNHHYNGHKMLTRILEITPKGLIFKRESPLLKNFRSMVRSDEKNCVLDPEGSIHYSIGEEYIMYNTRNKTISNQKLPLIASIIKLYGNDKIYFSLSTPLVQYGNDYLAVGHMKINYRYSYPGTSFDIFMEGKSFSHMTYVYCMFFYTMDIKTQKVKMMSDLFIPTLNNIHKPHLLVFPTGIIYDEELVTISYGDGDDRCRILQLTKQEVDKLIYLNVDDEILPEFALLNINPIVHIYENDKYEVKKIEKSISSINLDRNYLILKNNSEKTLSEIENLKSRIPDIKVCSEKFNIGIFLHRRHICKPYMKQMIDFFNKTPCVIYLMSVSSRLARKLKSFEVKIVFNETDIYSKLDFVICSSYKSQIECIKYGISFYDIFKYEDKDLEKSFLERNKKSLDIDDIFFPKIKREITELNDNEKLSCENNS